MAEIVGGVSAADGRSNKERFEFLELDTAGVVLVQDLEEGTHVLALN